MENPPIYVVLVVFAIFEGSLCVWVENQSALPQVTIQADDQSLEDTARRYLSQHSTTDNPYLEQVHTVGNQTRDPRGWSVAVVYYSLVCANQVTMGDDNDRWMKVKDVFSDPLAFDHRQLVDSCYQRLQNKSLYTSLPIFLLSNEFTLTELQKTYETILGFKIEKKSFRRRLLDAGFLEETSNIRRASHRPAQLYRLSSPQPHFFPRIIEGVRHTLQD
jgi:hypothetical protein